MSDKKIKKIIVNSLSISRIIGALLMPLFFQIFDIPGLIIIIICLFVTDCFDGILARHWHVQTKGGALLDALGDKLLAIACIVSFVHKHLILIPILVLELATTYLNVNRAIHGEKSVTLIVGKAKMWLVSITLVLCAINTLKSDFLSTINITVSESAILYFGVLTILMQIITIINYFEDSISQKTIRIAKVPKLKPFMTMMKILFDETTYEDNKNKSLVDILKEEA